MHFIAPGILILLGAFFIYQHHRYKHFHLHQTPNLIPLKNKIILHYGCYVSFSLYEIEAYFWVCRCLRFVGCYKYSSFISYHISFWNGIVVRLAYKGILN